MTDDTQDACATTPSEMFRMFVEDLKTADRVVIQRRNAIHNFDASYYPNPELIADLIEAQAAEVERLRASLAKIRRMTDKIAAAPMTADRWADRIEDEVLSAMNEKGPGD